MLTKRVIIALLTIGILCSATNAKYSGGTGEPNDPYQIADVNDLMTLANNAGDYNKCFILTADIDLDPNLPGNKVFTTAVIAPDFNNKNLIFDGVVFTGVFDGDKHKILKLTIDTNGVGNDYLGLFGFINSDAIIKDIGFQNVRITNGNNSCYLGGLVGQNEGNINNCFLNGLVTSGGCYSSYIGGLVGKNNGNTNYCYSIGTITGGFAWGVGSLVGTNMGNVSNCYSTSNITFGRDGISVCGVEDFGGLVGTNGSNITNSYFTGIVTAKGWLGNIGGLVGSGSPVINSYFLITSGPNNGL
jgi:hypothetical protein